MDHTSIMDGREESVKNELKKKRMSVLGRHFSIANIIVIARVEKKKHYCADRSGQECLVSS